MIQTAKFILCGEKIVHLRRNLVHVSRRAGDGIVVRQRNVASNASINSGLFSLGTIYSPKDFPTVASGAITRCDEVRKMIHKIEISSLELTSGDQNNSNINEIAAKTKDILVLYDSISNIICSVIDSTELCRNVHTSIEYRDLSEESFSTLSIYINELNSDHRMYSTLKHIQKFLARPLHSLGHLNSEDVIFIDDMIREYESDGIQFQSIIDREEVSRYQQEILLHETRYMQMASNDFKQFSFGPIPSKDICDRLRVWLSQYIQAKNDNNTGNNVENSDDQHLICLSSKGISNAVMCSLSEEHLRAEVWVKSHREPEGNMDSLGGLVQSRQLWAKKLGYDSYAHKFLQNKAFKTPGQVTAFLDSLHHNQLLQSQVEKEYQSLLELKRLMTRQDKLSPRLNNMFKGSSPVVSPSDILQPWDINYLIGVYRSIEQSKSQGKYQQESMGRLMNYLSLGSCINGLKLICKQLFGIDFIDIDMANDLSWVESSSGDSNTSGVYKYLAVDSSGQEIGIIYLDLFQRANKFPGAGHFTVRCGCDTTPTRTSNIIRDGIGKGSSLSHGTAAQTPIVALVFNINRTAAGTHADRLLLTLSNVETLFHEWGHAMHSLLSRTSYQHLAGTRGAVDFAEVPSHLFEHFAKTPEVVVQWARHYLTGEPPPLNLVADALRTKDNFQGIELQRQILYSAADQFIFGPDLGDLSKITNLQAYERILSGAEQLQLDYCRLPLADFSYLKDLHSLKAPKTFFPLLSHTHFLSYAGGYYSYIFAKMYATQIWKKRVEASPLSRETGDILWHRMLKFGASKDCQEILLDVAGGPLDPETCLQGMFSDQSSPKE